MADAFRSSDDFDEQAHQLYNEGRYDDALALLKEGISLYPLAVELHIGSAYAYLAREEYAWSRRSFERALALDPDHEDGLAGLGEVLLKLGERGGALRTFERVVLLGFKDDHELMLQIGRALFRENLIGPAQRFFDFAAAAQPDRPTPPPVWVTPATGSATTPEPSFTCGVRSSWSRASPKRGSISPTCSTTGGKPKPRSITSSAPSPTITSTSWASGAPSSCGSRSTACATTTPSSSPGSRGWPRSPATPTAIELLLAEVEAQQPDGSVRDPHQLELFGTLLSELHAMQRQPASGAAGRAPHGRHARRAHLRRHLGRDPAPDEGRRPRVGRRLAHRVHGRPRAAAAAPRPVSSSR